jgi:predicted short-subunit dehydrogenase-like oxidoreductase (DUF2520 family)
VKVISVGAGRLAWHLVQALSGAGHEVVQVYSRTEESAAALAAKVGAQPVCRMDDVGDADVYVVAVKDAVLADVVRQLCKGRAARVFLHTAGSMPMQVFDGLAAHYGVFYPMQTFSKERALDFSRIPIFLEGSDPVALGVARTLAESVSRQVVELSGEGRRRLHLAAVFACNFANHCYELASEVLQEQGLPFSVMQALVDETAAKVSELSPRQAQTGPAVRYDQNVMEAQLSLLADRPLAQQIYRLMSKSIHETALKEKQ